MIKESSLVATRQEPLRRLYSESAGDAVTVKRVRTVDRGNSDALHGTVVSMGPFPETVWSYGTDAKVGGDDDLPNAGHILCAALAACMDNIVRMSADLLGVELAGLEVQVTGDVDVRGCMAMDPAVRPGFRGMQCEVFLQPAPGSDPRRVAALGRSAERFCVTLDTLRHGTPVEVRFNPEVGGRTA